MDTDWRNLSTLRVELRRAGYETIEATSFEAAKDLLKTMRPAIVIADVRLGTFNGLHLLLRGQMRQPDLVGIVTSPFPDSVLQTETHRLGGTFVVKPVDVSHVLSVISRALRRAATEPARPWNSVDRRISERRHVVTPGFSPERRVAERRHQ